MTQQTAQLLAWPGGEGLPRRAQLRQGLRHSGFPDGDTPPSWLAASRKLWRLWRRRASEREQILRFTERELRDAGLTSGDVYRELSTPFWKADIARARPTD